MNPVRSGGQPADQGIPLSVLNFPHPILSIVIPVLAPDAELTRCVHSVFAAVKDLAQIEIVIVTPIRHVASISADFPMVKVCAEVRRGIYAAMNDGVTASCGDYLYFIGKDDIMLPTLQVALSVLERERPDALFCDVYWGASGRFSGKPSKIGILRHNLCHQGIFYSSQTLTRHGPYLRRMRVQADHLLNIKILWDYSTGSRISYLNQPLAWYSGAGFSNLHRDATFWRLYPTVLRRYVGAWAACLLRSYRWVRRASRSVAGRS